MGQSWCVGKTCVGATTTHLLCEDKECEGIPMTNLKNEALFERQAFLLTCCPTQNGQMPFWLLSDERKSGQGRQKGS